MIPKTLIAATACLLLVGCVSTDEESVGTTNTDVAGNWTITIATDSETGDRLLFANVFSEPGFDDEIVWLGLLCDAAELEVGFGLEPPFEPAGSLIITTQIDDGPVIDRPGDVFDDGEPVVGFASNDVTLPFLDDLASGFALTATVDTAGDVRGPALFDITGVDMVAQRIRRDCL